MQERIFLDALASYADSCVQPALTPSCPYYRNELGTPSCGEECRGILESRGVADRPVQSVVIGGLSMTGRSMPRFVVAGADEFDAGRLFLRDSDLPVREQSTAALMIGLRAEMSNNVLASSRNTQLALDTWGELTRRQINMDRVFAGGIAPSMAAFVSARAVIELLARDGLLDAESIFGSSSSASDPSWADIALATPTARESQTHARREIQLDPLFSILGSETTLLGGANGLRSIFARADVQYVLSPSFTRRVAAWFNGLAGHDLESALGAVLPAPDLFAALPSRETRQVGGLWIWERFTLTALEQWSSSSLIQEWQWSKGGSTDLCGHRTLSERVLSADRIAEVAMRGLADDDDSPVAAEMFDPALFVQAAANHLADGEWDKASKIFEGIVKLRPGDGEAWNNLGFCQLGKSAAIALPMLRRGLALQRPVPVISVANQVLALHLLGRDEEALEAADACLSEEHDWVPNATVWIHPASEGELELGSADPVTYLSALRLHVAEGQCDSRGQDAASGEPGQNLI
jgi:hypothetical protein